MRFPSDSVDLAVSPLYLGLSSTINYLDRIRCPVAPLNPRPELRLSDASKRLESSGVLSHLSICAPFAFRGLLSCERAAANRGSSLAVGLWSLAALSDELCAHFGGLLVCRALLGVAEAAEFPRLEQAIRRYLEPPKRAPRNSLNPEPAVHLGLILCGASGCDLAGGSYGWARRIMAAGRFGIPVDTAMSRVGGPA